MGEVEKDGDVKGEEIAFRAKSSAIGCLSGGMFFALFAVLSVCRKDRGWGVSLIVSLVFTVAFFVGFCCEVKKPSCLIEYLDGCLLIYAKGKRHRVSASEMRNAEMKKTRSRRIVLRSGMLTITTDNDVYKLYNVKDVEDVLFMLYKLQRAAETGEKNG